MDPIFRTDLSNRQLILICLHRTAGQLVSGAHIKTDIIIIYYYNCGWNVATETLRSAIARHAIKHGERLLILGRLRCV